MTACHGRVLFGGSYSLLYRIYRIALQIRSSFGPRFCICFIPRHIPRIRLWESIGPKSRSLLP